MQQKQLRGVVEGFYGNLWTAGQRNDMIDAVSKFNGNTYLYGPKFDQKHLKMWRQAYDEKECEMLNQASSHAKSKGIDFYWAISPGDSILDTLRSQPLEFSNQKDIDAVLRKFEQVSKLGIEKYALFFDDILLELKHDSDKEKYSDNMSLAQSDFVNEIAKRVGNDLIFVPSVYFGTSDYEAFSKRKNNLSTTHELDDKEKAYLSSIGNGVNPEIRIAWTGPAVCSETITTKDAESVAKLLKRKPLVWDNYPVNDFGKSRLHLGPLTGRDPDLMQETSGILFNPMEQEEASEIGVITGLIYADDPSQYDPKKAHEMALDHLKIDKNSAFVDLSSNSFLGNSREIDELVDKSDKNGLKQYLNRLLSEDCPFHNLKSKIDVYAKAALNVLDGETGFPLSKDIDVADLAFMVTNSLRDDYVSSLKNEQGFNLVDKFWVGHTQSFGSDNYKTRRDKLLETLNNSGLKEDKHKKYFELTKAAVEAVDKNDMDILRASLAYNFDPEIFIKMCNGF